MFFAVDVGNTQTVMGLYDSEQLLKRWRVATIKTDTIDELSIKIHALLSLAGFDGSHITDMAISSVVPPLTKQWQQVARRFGTSDPLILNSRTDIGLPIKYKNPSEIGADRLADAVAAISFYGAPVIVVDFGTATNIEVIDREGAFLGGIIAPGLVTSAEALFSAAARLAKIDIEVPASVIGPTTREAVQSGLTYGEIDRIDGLIKRVFKELGYRATVVATGGLSEHVVGLSEVIDVVNDDLTLEGLRLIYKRVRG
jgi:type III pantothenate kinase